jgi:amidase
MTTAATSNLCYATATELARRIRDREISSAEVTEAFLARIAAQNAKVNAIVHLLESDARARGGRRPSEPQLAPLRPLGSGCRRA